MRESHRVDAAKDRKLDVRCLKCKCGSQKWKWPKDQGNLEDMGELEGVF